MHISIVLTSLADSSRGETERRQECMLLEFQRGGEERDAFLAAVAKAVRKLAAEHNARFAHT